MGHKDHEEQVRGAQEQVEVQVELSFARDLARLVQVAKEVEVQVSENGYSNKYKNTNTSNKVHINDIDNTDFDRIE